jgi:hypothetical protein
MEIPEAGGSEISQLRLVFKYSPGAHLTGLGEGNRWCDSRAELPEFKRFVQSSVAYSALADSEASSVQISHSYV